MLQAYPFLLTYSTVAKAGGNNDLVGGHYNINLRQNSFLQQLFILRIHPIKISFTQLLFNWPEI